MYRRHQTVGGHDPAEAYPSWRCAQRLHHGAFALLRGQSDDGQRPVAGVGDDRTCAGVGEVAAELLLSERLVLVQPAGHHRDERPTTQIPAHLQGAVHEPRSVDVSQHQPTDQGGRPLGPPGTADLLAHQRDRHRRGGAFYGVDRCARRRVVPVQRVQETPDLAAQGDRPERAPDELGPVVAEPGMVIPLREYCVRVVRPAVVGPHLMGVVLEYDRQRQASGRLLDDRQVVLAAQQQVGEGGVDGLLPGQLLDAQVHDAVVHLRRDLDERDLALERDQR